MREVESKYLILFFLNISSALYKTMFGGLFVWLKPSHISTIDRLYSLAMSGIVVLSASFLNIGVHHFAHYIGAFVR